MAKNKPIMIDGVDVSECIFYQANFEEDFDVKIKHFCSNWHNSCVSINNSNCYFKQLTHKTQECEELKEDIERWKSNFNGKVSAIEELLQQLDQLKSANEQAEQKIEKIRQVCANTKDVGENIKDIYTAKLSGLYLKSRQILQIIDEVE